MPLTFGKKKKDVNESDFNGNYLRNFKKGETKVRFLEEPDEWVLYQEHYTDDRRAFPCTGDTQTCPGCTSEVESIQRRSRKYGTIVYLVDVNTTLPFKMAVSLANRMTARAERNGGTVTNRDYVVIRSGDGLKTEYDVDQDEKYSLDISALLKKSPVSSVEEVLSDMFQQVWGEPKQYEEPKVRAKVEDDPPFVPDPPKDEVPDALKTKEERESVPDADEDVTEAQLRAMSRNDLLQVWEKAGFDGLDEDWGKAELVQAILDRAE